METTTITLPDLKAGESYAGIIIDDNGSMHHVILLAGDADEATHQEQLDWAKSIGGDLPTRQEQSLLFANCKKHFKRDWYWSSELYEPASGYAWYQDFSNGIQVSYHKDGDGCRARAVRRLVIE